MFFQGNGEIGARSIAVFIGKNHTILAHDRADTGDDAAAGDVATLFRFIDLAAVEKFLPNVVARIQAQLIEVCSRIDQHFDEVAHRFFALLGQSCRLSRTTNVVGFFTMLQQNGVLLFPMFQVGFSFFFQPFSS